MGIIVLKIIVENKIPGNLLEKNWGAPELLT